MITSVLERAGGLAREVGTMVRSRVLWPSRPDRTARELASATGKVVARELPNEPLDG